MDFDIEYVDNLCVCVKELKIIGRLVTLQINNSYIFEVDPQLVININCEKYYDIYSNKNDFLTTISESTFNEYFKRIDFILK